MKVLFTSLREKSHFSALIPFIEACQRGGHTVAVAAPPDLAERVAAAGATFFPVGHPGDERLRPIWARMRGVPEAELNRIAIGEIFAGACGEAALPSVVGVIESWAPSIVLHESCEWSGFVAAEKLGVPHARVAICAPGFEATIRSVAGPYIEAHRERLGVPLDPSGERMRSEPSLTLFPRTFDAFSEGSAPLHRFRTTQQAAPPLPQWWGTREGPFVYATLGTVSGKFEMVHAAYRETVDGLSALPIRVLLTTGDDLPLAALGEVPANVHVERFVPQDHVIPHAAAALCHAGSGTVLGMLAAGVPMVAMPLFADQSYNAQQIAATGVGVAVAGGDGRVERIRNAMQRVLDEPSIRSRARDIEREIVELPRIDEAARVIEQLAAQ